MSTVSDTLRMAQDALGGAREAYDIFHSKTDPQGSTYVTFGHEAMRTIDAVLRALGEAREELVTEIREDRDERSARVDAMLARFDAESATVHFPYGHVWSCGRTIHGQTSTDRSDITCVDCLSEAAAAPATGRWPGGDGPR